MHSALPFDSRCLCFFSDGNETSLPEVEIVFQIPLLHFAQIQKMGVWSSQGNKKLFTLQDPALTAGLAFSLNRGQKVIFPIQVGGRIAETPANDYPNTDSPFGQGLSEKPVQAWMSSYSLL